jgi:hypothetical protein
MQFEQNTYSPPFGYPNAYPAYVSPTPGMPRPPQPFYEAGYGVPTPAPSPRSPSSARRSRSNTQDYMGSGEYMSGKRPSSRRSGAHEYNDFEQHRPTTSPRPGSHRPPTGFMHTPLHTPPPSSHAQHGTPMPNIYSYVPGFSPQEYFSYTPAPGPQSPPPFEGRRSRAHRRESTRSGENSPRSPPRTGSTKPTTPQRPQAEGAPTEESDLRAKAASQGIPSDYSLKNWDPQERPIILLGSVFDANSLGEWVFNWTKYHHGRTHEATRTAGGLWELLIELSSKLKRAHEFFASIQTQENREIVEDFIQSGDRLWIKLKTLLKSCEEYMWTGARRVNSPKYQEGKTKVQMGKQSGAEFVDAMFNGEKEWEKTERLMRGMATWCQRFQVNCEDILRRPDA